MRSKKKKLKHQEPEPTEDLNGESVTAETKKIEVEVDADELNVKAAAEEVEDETEKFQAESAENYDKYLRAVAELENFKKRAIRERADVIKYAGEGLIRDLLEVYDSLQLAVSQEHPGSDPEFVKGVEIIFDQLKQIFERHSVTVESALGEDFDPNKHEAMAMVPTAEQPPGSIMEELKPAVFFRDRLLRPAQVVVAKEPESEDS